MHGCINPKQNTVLKKKNPQKKENTEVIKTLSTIVNCKRLLMVYIYWSKGCANQRKTLQHDPPFSAVTHHMLLDSLLQTVIKVSSGTNVDTD